MTAKKCDAVEAECHCNRETRHKIHRCDCGGSWTYDAAGLMHPRTFPGGYRDLFAAMDRLLWPGLF